MIRVGMMLLALEKESAKDLDPGEAPSAPPQNLAAARLRCCGKLPKRTVTTRNAGKTVRKDEYAAPLATENCPC